MQISLITPNELTNDHLIDWKQWQQQNVQLRSPFLSPEFAIAYGRHNKSVRIAVIEIDNKVQAFLPYERSRWNVARALGFGLVDVQGIIASAAARFSLREVLRECDIDVFTFDRFVDSQTPMLDSASFLLERSPVIDITPGWDSWIETKRKVSKARFRRMFQKGRKLERDIGPMSFVLQSASHADLEQLMKWKSAQYRRTCRHDRFGDAWFRNVMHELHELHELHEQSTIENSYGNAARGTTLRTMLSRLSVGDRCVAIDFALTNGHDIAGWFPAYDLEYQAYSVGSLCLLKQIEEAANEGYSRIDLGVGEADYKEAFKDFDDTVVIGRSSRLSLGAAYEFLRHAPRQTAERIVPKSSPLRAFARTALQRVGSLRAQSAVVSAELVMSSTIEKL